MDSLDIRVRSIALLEEIAKTRAERERVVEAARAERRRSRRLREESQAWREQSLGHVWDLFGENATRVPDHVPLEWTEPVALEAALQAALRSAQECAAVCLECAMDSAIFLRIPFRGITSSAPLVTTETLVAGTGILVGVGAPNAWRVCGAGCEARGVAACWPSNASCTSSLVTRPLGPVPETPPKSIFRSRASLRVAGVANT